MAYMNQEKKKQIVEKAKPILKKYGMKATFKCSTHSITCTLKSGSIDFIGNMNRERNDLLNPHKVDYEALRYRYHFAINQYWYNEHYVDGPAKNFIREMNDAFKAADWYDRSDIQTDYFDTAYYYNLEVGSWGKPYILTK